MANYSDAQLAEMYRAAIAKGRADAAAVLFVSSLVICVALPALEWAGALSASPSTAVIAALMLLNVILLYRSMARS